MGIDINSELGRKLIAAQGRIESGYLANERTLRAYYPIHVRVAGDNKTLCGQDLTGDLHFYWCSVGQFALRMPSYVFGRPYYEPCKRCLKSPVVKITHEVDEARRRAFAGRLTQRELVPARGKKGRGNVVSV